LIDRLIELSLVRHRLFLCAWIPCVIDGCKDVVHTCPSCGAVVGRHHRLGGGYGGYGYGRYRRNPYYYWALASLLASPAVGL